MLKPKIIPSFKHTNFILREGQWQEVVCSPEYCIDVNGEEVDLDNEVTLTGLIRSSGYTAIIEPPDVTTFENLARIVRGEPFKAYPKGYTVPTLVKVVNAQVVKA